MIRSLHAQMLASAQAAFRAGDFEAVLQQTHELLKHFAVSPLPLPVGGGGLPEVDFLLDALGGKLCGEFKAGAPPAEGEDWVLATCIYETGGHTPVMDDLASALLQGLGGLVLTLVGQSPLSLTPQALARTGLRLESIHRADGASLLETCRHVLRHFQSRPPRRLFLFQHPEDTVAVTAAAVLAAAGTEVWLIHGADHFPSAGLFLPGVRLLDLTPRTCAFTRHVLGLDSVWLPLTCPDPGLPPSGFRRNGHLTTALAGSQWKSSQEDLHRYPELLADLLHTSGGTHVHIGPLADSQRGEIAQALRTRGIDETRFVHVPLARTLVEALQNERVDLLLNTWPLGGARTSVEAMSAGIPLVWHSPHSNQDRLRLQMAWPGAPVWRRPSDLMSIVSAADSFWLQTQSTAARRHYEERHHPSHWRRFFSALGASSGFALPEGYDATLFLPALWNHLLDHAIEADDPRIYGLQESCQNLGREIGRHQEKLRKHDQAIRKNRQHLSKQSSMNERLRNAETGLNEARFPWPVRFFRRWWKRKGQP